VPTVNLDAIALGQQWMQAWNVYDMEAGW